jgi:hypothetical protein
MKLPVFSIMYDRGGFTVSGKSASIPIPAFCLYDCMNHWFERLEGCYHDEAKKYFEGGIWNRLVADALPGDQQEIRMKKTIYWTLLFLSAAILLSTGISTDSSRAADSSKITIAYSSNILGYLESCG